ncbi:MAG TPA: transposase [Dehalococcoidia bacterium]|jgi:transposase
MATVAVLSGPERRRRWSATEKARIVEESLAPGATVTVVAQRHDVHRNLLHYWRRQARRAVETSGDLKLLPVRLTGASAPTSRAAGAIEIELGGGIWVRVDSRVDEAALGRVLRALGR